MCGSAIKDFIGKLPGSDTPIHNALGVTGGDDVNIPDPPVIPDSPAPVSQNQRAIDAANEQRRRRQRASGQQSTILTGPGGSMGSSTAGKTLLGA
ncbi:hypothetical protein [Halomonas cupida]|uniref:hypothetical protein n=1 Tax=Halomonas cupida TaxID=44933 RepID=UPI0039B56F14